MFPTDDINSFTVQYSDQFLLYSTLLDDADIDDYNHNPFSPFSFYDQNMAAHPLFFSSDDQQQLELQANPLVQHHEEEEEEPMLTAFEEFTMADTSTNTRTNSFGAYCTTENLQHNGPPSDPTNGISTSAVGGMKIDKVSKNVNLSKKDRHSKINTAQGPRDRRMRLSLDIAKRFFGLQDMLGFDKASKTVDWLLSKSQSEINKVAGKAHDGNNVATTKSSDSFGASECCEEVSEVVNKDEISQSGEMDTNLNAMNKKSSAKTKKKSTGKVSAVLRNGFNNLAKESREKARARARERTKEKMLLCTSQSHNKQDANHTSNMDQNMWNQVLGPHAYSSVDQEHHIITNQDEYLANTFHWTPSSSSCSTNNLQQQITGTSQQLPFDQDLQFYAKPWETYN